MSIFQKSVKNPITTILVYVAIAIIGIYSLSKLAIDFLPDMGSNTIMVFTNYQGASAIDIENNVTKPLENVLNSVSDLKHINSSSRENYSVITLEFQYGINIDEATNNVRDKLDMVSAMLPDNASKPFIFKFSTQDIPIMMLAVESHESTNALYKILDNKVASTLSRINGVGTVSITGAPQREINIYCDPYKLESYGLTIEGITSVVRSENISFPLGSIDVGSETYSMRVKGEFEDASLMNDIVVGSYNNKNIYLRDVAVVCDTIQERLQEVYTNGSRGASIVIQKQTGSNSVSVAKEIKKILPDILKTLPPDIQIDTIFDTSESIIDTINSLEEAIIVILVLVVFVVMFFLGRWRATFIIAIVIPVSLIASFIYLFMTGNSLNIVSLSSLSIAIGMVVDDAIVVLENISKHIERGSKPKPAAVFATSEVSLAVIASSLVLLAVFLPLTMLGGMMGILFRQLGWVITIIIFVSTVAALTLTPMLSSLLLRNNPNRGKVFNFLFTPIEKGLNKIDDGYGKLLNWAVAKKSHLFTVVIISLLIFIGSLSLFPIIRTEFFPTKDSGQISMTLKFPVGTRMETSREFGLAYTAKLQKLYPEMVRCNFSVGIPSEDNSWGRLMENGTHQLSFNLRFTKKTQRKRGILEIADMIREDLSQYPELNTYKVTVGGGGAMGGQSGVSIEIYGYDFDVSDKYAAEIVAQMRKVKGCTEANISRSEYSPEIQIDFDRKKLEENGLSTALVSTFIQNRFSGSIASYFREDGDEYYVKVRYAPQFRQSVDAIENILIYNARGNGIRVRDLGKVVERLTPPTIERKDRERVLKVDCVVGKGAALSDIASAAFKVLDNIEKPAGISTIVAGTYKDQQESFADIALLSALILILVYIVMASQFESFVYPFVIILSVPFALTGVLIGLAVTHTALGIMAAIGTMMLVGIVVKNGIVLIDYTILCRERGMNIQEAVVAAGRSRLRPILMTTITTVLGTIPLAVGKGEGAEMWNAMGMCIAWGLSFSTLITLILIPVVYALFAKFGIWRKKNK